MKKKINQIISVILFLFLVTSWAYSQGASLQLTMKPDKDKYKLGEEIKLYCKVQNVSGNIVKFCPYNQKNIEIRDAKGNPCIRELLKTAEWAESMVALRPKGIL